MVNAAFGLPDAPRGGENEGTIEHLPEAGESEVSIERGSPNSVGRVHKKKICPANCGRKNIRGT